MTDYDVIFVHIPRTAGRSISAALGLDFSKEHRNLRDYIRKLTEPVVRNIFKFTVVRNPWERSVSCWAYFHVHTHSKFINQGAVDFDTWVKNGGESLLDELYYCKNDKGEVLMNSFLKFETIGTDFLPIAQRFNVSPVLPKIGENKQEQIQKIAIQSISIDGRPPLTLTENYRDMYKSQKTVDIVGSLNKKLIADFGYTF
jgi:hypothetical protein